MQQTARIICERWLEELDLVELVLGDPVEGCEIAQLADTGKLLLLDFKTTFGNSLEGSDSPM